MQALTQEEIRLVKDDGTAGLQAEVLLVQQLSEAAWGPDEEVHSLCQRFPLGLQRPATGGSHRPDGHGLGDCLGQSQDLYT